MSSTDEVYESLMVSSRSSTGERLNVPNGGLTGSGGGGIRYTKLLVADDRETMAVDVKNMAVDAQPEAVGEGEEVQKILRFQSEVVRARGGVRLLSHRV